VFLQTFCLNLILQAGAHLAHMSPTDPRWGENNPLRRKMEEMTHPASFRSTSCRFDSSLQALRVQELSGIHVAKELTLCGWLAFGWTRKTLKRPANTLESAHPPYCHWQQPDCSTTQYQLLAGKQCRKFTELLKQGTARNTRKLSANKLGAQSLLCDSSTLKCKSGWNALNLVGPSNPKSKPEALKTGNEFCRHWCSISKSHCFGVRLRDIAQDCLETAPTRSRQYSHTVADKPQSSLERIC
jgi:hypothetical protein